MPHVAYIVFFFAIGACIGSFLNVVVWRLPRGESLVTPPSHCPHCNHPLRWYDNLPIIGWIKLGGRCRYCREKISPRYPIVEAITAGLFVLYYVAYYVLQWRTCCPLFHSNQFTIDEFGQVHPVAVGHWFLADSWPIFCLYLILISGLFAASLIDAELYIIPLQIPWVIAVIAVIVHSIADRPSVPGSLNLIGEYAPAAAAFAAGGSLGLGISVLLWALGIMPTSFPLGEPLLEVDRKAIEAEIHRAQSAGEQYEEQHLPPPYTSQQIRVEIGKEILFLLPPLVLAGAGVTMTLVIPSLKTGWSNVLQYDWLTGFLGSLLGGLIGAFIVWAFRIMGTLVLRRVAMGLGDVHLMFAVGAVIGAGGAIAAFFIAPAFGILVAIYMMITRKGREMPLGPYLSLATAIVMLCYCPIAAYFSPGLQGLLIIIGGWFGRS